MPRIQYNQSVRDRELADALRRQAQNLQSTQIQEAGGRVLATNPLAALNTALSPMIAGYYDRKASEQEKSAADKLAKLYADPKTTPQQIAAAQIEQGDLNTANEVVMRTIRQASKDDIPAGATPEELQTGAKGYRMPDGSFYETSPAMSAYQAKVMDVDARRERGLADSGSKFITKTDEQNREVVMPADVAAGYKQQEYAPAVVGPSMQEKKAVDVQGDIQKAEAVGDINVATDYAQKKQAIELTKGAEQTERDRNTQELYAKINDPAIDEAVANVSTGWAASLNDMKAQATGEATPNMKARQELITYSATLMPYAHKQPGVVSDHDAATMEAQVGILKDPKATQGEVQAALKTARALIAKAEENRRIRSAGGQVQDIPLPSSAKPKMSREEFMRMRLGR